MRSLTKTLIGGLAAVVVSAGLIAASPAAQASTDAPARTTRSAAAADALSSPVTGSFTDAQGGAGTFAGTFVPTSFDVVDGTTAATGTLTGTLTDSTGTSLGSVEQTATVPVAADQSSSSRTTAALAACQILDLRLQPIDLDLLGLKVHTDTIHLNITAQSGSGELLGNLLCAVAGLLDGGNLGAQLAALLNQILAILNGL